MTRVPKTKSRLKKRRAGAVSFEAAPGSRRLAGGMCAVLAVMFLIHQTQVEGLAILIRLFAAACMAGFAVLAWYFLRRGARRGPVMTVGPEGFGMALGFSSWVEIPWSAVEAFRYWEPTGIALLVKRRQARWIGILLSDTGPLKGLPWDARFEIWLNRFFNRPGLCLLHPFVRAPILDVLQAFKDFAPKETDDYKWMSR